MLKFNLLFSLLLILANNMMAQSTHASAHALNQKEQQIVLVAANTARGDMAALKQALNGALNAGLTISELKETLVQLYAYTGFPRSLNALHKLMEVLAERKKNGLTDPPGKEPSPLPAGHTMLQTGTANQTKLVGTAVTGDVYQFAPAIDRFLKEHLFGAIFSRDNLDWKTRELVTISALAAIDGAAPQLRSHFNVGIYNGLTANQLAALVNIIESNINKQRGLVAREVLQSVLDKKAYTANPLLSETIFPTGQPINNNNFVGTAWLQPLVQPDSNNKLQVGNVSFEPGARTRWHKHPAGQILLAIDGLGYYQEQGSAKRLLRKGDVVKCPADTPHWHGAAPDEKFIQVAINSIEAGVTVWLNGVTEEEYKSAPVNDE